jgi:hypothetical protein
MAKRWQDIAKDLIDELIDRKYPTSVIDAVRGAMLLNPDKTVEIDHAVRECTTPREVVRSVQIYYRLVSRKNREVARRE